MKENNNDFEYNYVAPTSEERKEIESIRNNYISQNKSVDKLEILRKLDNKVKSIPTIISLIFGIVGLLIFGLGLTMILEWKVTIGGIIVGAIGVIPMILAYPMYRKISNNLKNKYSDEIIKLSDELLNENR